MIDCTLITCEALPKLDPDDQTLADELRARGLSVSIEVWSNPNVDWAESRLCIIRSTWDYHGRYPEFLNWLERVASVTEIRNDRHLVRWNAHKSYIHEIEMLGIPIVPTALVAMGQSVNVWDVADERDWLDIVIKPARGAAAHNVMRVGRAPESLTAGQAHFDRLVATQDVLVQSYLEKVNTYGERALVFFHGRYSHAVKKKPFDTILVVNRAPSALVRATEDEIGVATRAVSAVPGAPLYARVDLLRDNDSRICVSEVELIEPGLYLAVHGPARATFADALERELDEIRASPQASTRPACDETPQKRMPIEAHHRP